MKHVLLALALLSATALACRSTESAGAAPRYTLVHLLTGPQSGKLSQEENTRAFAGHFANMERMVDAGELVLAGPFGERRHDPDLRGLFVLTTAEREEARRWAETDPTTQVGVFRLEYHDLATAASLAAALERDRAWRASMATQGKTPQPGEHARPYVLLTAEHGDLAERELGALATKEGGVLLLGRLDGTRALALLDAADLDEAQVRFAPQLEHLGAHVLDEWYATEELARMVE